MHTNFWANMSTLLIKMFNKKLIDEEMNYFY